MKLFKNITLHFNAKRFEKMRKRNLNKITEKSTLLCMKDAFKKDIRSFDDHAQLYFLELQKILSSYDWKVLLISYQNYVIKKYDLAYYHNHRELEILAGLISENGIQKEILSFSQLMKQIPSKRTIKKIELLLRKYAAVFFLNENPIMNSDNNIQSLYEQYKRPEHVMRFKTNYIRNEGVGRQYLDYIKEILRHFDKTKYRKNKFPLGNLTDAMIDLMNFPTESKKNMLGKSQTRFSYLRKMLADVFNLDIIETKNILSYFFNDFFTTKSCFLSGIIRFYLSSFYCKNELQEIFHTKNDEIIDKLTILTNSNIIRNIWLENPIWSRPFISLNTGNYIYIIPRLPLTFMEQMIESILNENEREGYQQIKTRFFMENKIEELIISKYPKLNLYPNIKYFSDGKKYESDFLVIYNNFALIIEAKGHNLTKKAKMGNSLRLENRIKKIIEEAAVQANRLKKIISKKKKQNIFLISGQTVVLDFSKISETITLSVSFEWLIFFSTAMDILRKKHEIDDGHIHCSLSELDIIADIFENEDQFMYYFYRRSLIEKSHFPLKSDELDLVTYFIEKGFRFRLNEGLFIDITGEYDRHPNSDYYHAKYNLCTKEDDYILQTYRKKYIKISFKQTKFIKIHVDYFDATGYNNVYLTGYFNTLPYSDQLFLEKQINKASMKLVNKLSVSKFQIDRLSPSLISVVLDNELKNYNNTIEQIRKNFLIKEHNDLGNIIILYKIFDNIIKIEKIQFIK